MKKRDAKKLSKEDWTVVAKKGPGRPKKEVPISSEDDSSEETSQHLTKKKQEYVENKISDRTGQYDF